MASGMNYGSKLNYVKPVYMVSDFDNCLLQMTFDLPNNQSTLRGIYLVCLNFTQDILRNLPYL